MKTTVTIKLVINASNEAALQAVEEALDGGSLQDELNERLGDIAVESAEAVSAVTEAPSAITIVTARVDAPALVQSFDGSLAAMQKLVGGYIECVHVDVIPGVDLWINEDGIARRLPHNFDLPVNLPAERRAPGKTAFHRIFGDAFFARSNDEGEMVSLTDTDVSKVMALLKGVR